jgi:hypothetical protein
VVPSPDGNAFACSGQGLPVAVRPGMLGGVGHTTRMRWAAIVAGLAFIAGGIALGIGPYDDRRAFEKASLCGAAPRDDCITQVRMTVLSKSRYTTQDPDPNWPPPQPPQPPPPQPPLGPFRIAPALTGQVLATLPMSETTHYKLKVRTADGRSHTYEVDGAIYEAAKPGMTGIADVWHGRVARLRIGTHSDEQWSYWRLGAAWVLCWIGVMLIAGWGLPLAAAPVVLVVGAWWAGIIFIGLADVWHAAVWAIPAIFAGAVVTMRVVITVSDRRYRSAVRRF